MVRHRRDENVLKPLRWPLWLTWIGLFAERALRAFWVFASILMVVLAALMMGLQDQLSVEMVWVGAVLSALAGAAALIRGVMRFKLPHRTEAMARLDETLPGRPIRALLDQPAIGREDASSMALWQAHQARMKARASTAKAAKPNLRLAQADPYALRYVATLALTVALLFGSIWKVGSVVEMTPGGAQAAVGPSWEGWVEPPRYTGLPTLYLNDLSEPTVTFPEGSRVILRFYGQVGDLSLAETISGRVGEIPPATQPQQDFTIKQSGTLRIDGLGGQEWEVEAVPDNPPEIAISGLPEAEAGGIMVMPYEAQDDYGVIRGEVQVTLDLEAVDRRFGLSIEPETREDIVLDVPLPITGDRRLVTDQVIEDFSEHPWAHLPVKLTVLAEDAAGQQGLSVPVGAILPARNFFDPLAAAIIEQRRDLLWSRDNAVRVAQVLRAISHRPEGFIRSNTGYLRLRSILRRLETFTEYGLSTEQRDEIAQALWELALKLEDGDVSDALERMRQAQERLSQAMRNGASESEIAELMQELRDATQDYLRQLSRQAQREQQETGGPQSGSPQDQNGTQMTQDDLQRMMDRIQELMEQGRMAEAQQALQELQELMENMRVTQGQGQNGQQPGQQAMEGLAETLREQQGLSDQAFRDLQEQFNPDGQQGQGQGEEPREGQGQGRGEGQGQAPGAIPGQPGQSGPGGQQQSLADRQQALRDELQRQQDNLPGTGTEEGEAARDALDRAGEAMDRAEDALRDNELADAIDEQAQAMEALREGMRSLGEALAQQQGQPGQNGRQGNQQTQNRDPLGRTPPSANGSTDTTGEVDLGGDVYRRAMDLLEEIQRRSGETGRTETERNYLQRLLDRF
ncbi:MAG: TIGR02302 family protein [Rhodobacteraceae bacterium]|nr:TIGR02302 family protein [Paracoccaceae bacterium]